MKSLVVSVICIALTTSTAALACSEEGMYGVTFGQYISGEGLEVNEQTSAGITYYWFPITEKIKPFQNLVVGVTPKSRRVFSIMAELHGSKEFLSTTIINQVKETLERQHKTLSWRVEGNYHYGEKVNFEVIMFTMGDLVNGNPTHLLTYSCDSYEWRKKAFKEAFER